MPITYYREDNPYTQKDPETSTVVYEDDTSRVEESTNKYGFKTQTFFEDGVKVNEFVTDPDGLEVVKRNYTPEGMTQIETIDNLRTSQTVTTMYDKDGVIKSFVKRDSSTGELLEERFYNDKGEWTRRIMSNGGEDNSNGEDNLTLETKTQGYTVEVNGLSYEENYDNENDLAQCTSIKWERPGNDNLKHTSEVLFDEEGYVIQMVEVDGNETRIRHFNPEQVIETDSLFKDEERRQAVINNELKVVEINRKDEKNQPIKEEFKYDEEIGYITSYKVQDFDENGNKRESTTYYKTPLKENGPWTRQTFVNGILRETTEKEITDAYMSQRTVTRHYNENGEISSMMCQSYSTGPSRASTIKFDKNQNSYEIELYQKNGDEISHRIIDYQGNGSSKERDNIVLGDPFSYMEHPLEGNYDKETIEIAEEDPTRDIKKTVFDKNGNYTVTTYNAFSLDPYNLPECFAALDSKSYKSKEEYDSHNNLVSRENKENNELVSQPTLPTENTQKSEPSEGNSNPLGALGALRANSIPVSDTVDTGTTGITMTQQNERP